jgi:ubiquinone/menaquinone biosynthesis C-methylase UbiE
MIWRRPPSISLNSWPAFIVHPCMEYALPKPHKDRGMEGAVAKWYAANTGKALDDFKKLAQRIAGQLPLGGAVLDVAPGPGYFSIELAKLGPYNVTGLDISHTFVEIASRKAAEAGVQVNFQQGNAARMPFPDEAFDFLLCRAAFKNFAEPVRAVQEMCRVLKPGGRGLIIDLRRDVSPGLIKHHVDAMGLTAFNKVLTKLTFRLMLIKSAYTKEQFQQMLAQASFQNVDIQEVDIGFEILMTK